MKSFPPPLTPKEESELLRRSADSDNEARHILIERNLRLVAHVIKNISIWRTIQKIFCPSEPSDLSKQFPPLTRTKKPGLPPTPAVASKMNF